MATTELNKVEGFDPKQYARTIQDANGQESLYLDVQYRKMWFRLCNPTGKIVKKICTFDGNLAVVEARIYLDRNDAPENFVSNAFAQRFVDPNNPEYGTRYLESAETAAVGRALADAGYGLQFCMEPDPTPVDMGQTPFAMAPDRTVHSCTNRCKRKLSDQHSSTKQSSRTAAGAATAVSAASVTAAECSAV